MSATPNATLPENAVGAHWEHPLVRLGSYRYGREDSVLRIAKREGKSRQWIYMNQLPAPTPSFDAEGYPTDETLRVIREWPIKSNFAVQDLLGYAQEAWRYSFKIRTGGLGRKRWIYTATSGWSGNEEIIGALQENRIFWACCWLESHRGGGFKFLTAPFNETNVEVARTEGEKSCASSEPEWKPDYTKTPRRVVCAANRQKDDGRIICGARHWDKVMRSQITDVDRAARWDQGFIDQFGNWMTREEAWLVAADQNQIRRRCGGDGECLFSENLY